MPPDWLLWLVVLVVLGPTALVIALYGLAGLAIGVLMLLDKVTP